MTPSPFREATCPACGHHVAALFFDGGHQPLATLSWPASAAEAQALPRLPLDFVRCLDCGHVFNASFDYAKAPYSQKPNLMFNGAVNWSHFLKEVQGKLLSQLVDGAVVVEIGHGDGSFLRALARAHPSGRYFGFDPHGAAQGSEEGSDGVEFRALLFEASRHLAELRPQLIISRHVLEHLVNPLGFLQSLSLAASIAGLATLAYFEVPCIDQAVASQRSVDFYYEHSSQFTTDSFTRMLSRSVHRILEIGHGYGGEVIFGMVGLGVPSSTLQALQSAQEFRVGAETAQHTISDQLAELHRTGKRIAIWGGTGKSAAFICRHGVDRERFPVVVDSDIAKVGTFVPGTGQEIRSRNWLLTHRVDVVIVPPQWRAADIILEMGRAGISVESVLIEHKGELIDYRREDHPYR
jgi:hypothetical protein